jgi:putative oxidoreductase
MTGLSFLVVLAIRYLLVMLFFPFSALDKILNFKGAVGQAQEVLPSRAAASAMLLAGLFVEIVMPICILTGYADRLAALIMAGYCMITALLWKRFWATGDFWAGSNSKGRGLFWDFLKNFSLAGGFLLITFGSLTLTSFLHDPLSSTHPYATAAYGPVAGEGTTP